MIVATYNIQHGGTAGLDFEKIGGDVKAVGADIVGLQEIDINTARCPKDSMALLTDGTGLLHGAFAAAMDYRGGQYGIGVLSRKKPRALTVHRLPELGLEPRVCIAADMGKFVFLNTHTAYETEAANRAHIAELLKITAALTKPFILVGDFNTEDFSPFEEAGLTLANTGRRFRSFYPGDKAIDNIVLSKGVRLAAAGMYCKTNNSDHYMIWAEVRSE